jgi:hypothetical protein
LKEVKYVPGLWRNLFSVKSALKEEATLKSKRGECMVMEKGKVNLKFCETTENGCKIQNQNGSCTLSIKSRNERGDDDLPQEIGAPPCKDLTKKTANYLGIITLTGSWTGWNTRSV